MDQVVYRGGPWGHRHDAAPATFSKEDVLLHVRPSQRPAKWTSPFQSFSRFRDIAAFYAGPHQPEVHELDLSHLDPHEYIDLCDPRMAQEYLDGSTNDDVRARGLALRSGEVLVLVSALARVQPTPVATDNTEWAAWHDTGAARKYGVPDACVKELENAEGERVLMLWAPLCVARDVKVGVSTAAERRAWLRDVLLPPLRLYHVCGGDAYPAPELVPLTTGVFGAVVLLPLGAGRGVADAPTDKDYAAHTALDCVLGNLEAMQQRKGAAFVLTDEARTCVRVVVRHTLGEFLAEDADRSAGPLVHKFLQWGPFVREMDTLLFHSMTDDVKKKLEHDILVTSVAEQVAALRRTLTAEVVARELNEQAAKVAVLQERMCALALLMQGIAPAVEHTTTTATTVTSSMDCLFVFAAAVRDCEWHAASRALCMWVLWWATDSTARVHDWLKWSVARFRLEGRHNAQQEQWWQLALTLVRGFHFVAVHKVEEADAYGYAGMARVDGLPRDTHPLHRVILRTAAASLGHHVRSGSSGGAWDELADEVTRAVLAEEEEEEETWEGALEEWERWEVAWGDAGGDDVVMCYVYALQLRGWAWWNDAKERARGARMSDDGRKLDRGRWNMGVIEEVYKEIPSFWEQVKKMHELQSTWPDSLSSTWSETLRHIAVATHALELSILARVYRECTANAEAVRIMDHVASLLGVAGAAAPADETVRARFGRLEMTEFLYQHANAYRFHYRHDNNVDRRSVFRAKALEIAHECVAQRKLMTDIALTSESRDEHDKQLCVAKTLVMRIQKDRLSDALYIHKGAMLAMKKLTEDEKQQVREGALSVEGVMAAAPALCEEVRKLQLFHGQRLEQRRELEKDAQDLLAICEGRIPGWARWRRHGRTLPYHFPDGRKVSAMFG